MFFEVLFATAIPHCWHIISERFYVSIVDFLGIDVNNNYLAVKKEKTVVVFWHDFAYVLDLGLPSKFVVSNET